MTDMPEKIYLRRMGDDIFLVRGDLLPGDIEYIRGDIFDRMPYDAQFVAGDEWTESIEDRIAAIEEWIEGHD